MADAKPTLPAPLVEALRRVRSAGVITGAGVSAESGVPTYRGKGGLYEEDESRIEALTGTTLRSDPDRTWRAVGDLARHAAGAVPNAAHFAIAEIERKVARFVLLTQNVDGLHQAAGSRNVIDIHGSITRTRCMACGAEGELSREELEAIHAAPRCAGCGGTLRPAAVLFGEMLPVEKVARMQRELLDDPPELVLVVGTSALFPYIVEPVLVARRARRLTVEVNPEPTVLSPVVGWFLEGSAAALVPEIAREIG
ncbi:MAG: NAD-dependent protein deacylase [Planctomycetes bacterium]|nr:NAD-dependent protein deacylase [Planctomycetota bacterium]